MYWGYSKKTLNEVKRFACPNWVNWNKTKKSINSEWCNKYNKPNIPFYNCIMYPRKDECWKKYLCEIEGKRCLCIGHYSECGFFIIDEVSDMVLCNINPAEYKSIEYLKDALFFDYEDLAVDCILKLEGVKNWKIRLENK